MRLRVVCENVCRQTVLASTTRTERSNAHLRPNANARALLARVPRPEGVASVSESPRADGESGCPKCGHTDASVGDISTTGSGLSKMFDIQTNKFRTVTCTNCGYTELYKDVGSSGGDLVDIFFG